MAQPHGHMDTFVLVRPMARVGATPVEELKALSAKSNDAVRECHHDEQHIKWIHSYVTDDATYCVYKASSVEVLKVRQRWTSGTSARASKNLVYKRTMTMPGGAWRSCSARARARQRA
jgi:hypothetical protein